MNFGIQNLWNLFRNFLGGGADISAANPIPVTLFGGPKVPTEVLNQPAIAAATTTVLNDCAAIDMSGGATTLTLTIKAIYDAAAALGIRLHVLTSPTGAAAGLHTAAVSATILTDATAHWVAGRLVGETVTNVTDGSTGVITANTVNTATVLALAGGTLNVWTLNDVYSIAGGGYDTVNWDTWNPFFAANTVIMETRAYGVAPAFVKVLVENLDAAQPVTIVELTATVGG